MPPITVGTDVDAPASAVFSYATDPRRFHEWQEGVTDGRLETLDDSPQPGTRCITTRRIGGIRRSSTSEVTRNDPARSWSVRGTDGPIRAAVDLTVEPLGPARSRVTVAVDFEGRGLGRVLVPLVVRGQARREMPANLARLKQRIESSRPGPAVPGRADPPRS